MYQQEGSEKSTKITEAQAWHLDITIKFSEQLHMPILR